jgi:hypothetical protein
MYPAARVRFNAVLWQVYGCAMTRSVRALSDEPAPRELSWAVDSAAAGERLDRHVAARLDLPRNQIQKWIRDGALHLAAVDTHVVGLLPNEGDRSDAEASRIPQDLSMCLRIYLTPLS